MKKIISICLCLILALSFSITAFATEAEPERCVFCGKENTLINSDYCTSCGESFYHRSSLRVNIKSYGNEDDLIEAYLYRNGRVYRLNQTYGNNSFVEFESVTDGTYLLQVIKNGHVTYCKTVYLYSKKPVDKLNGMHDPAWFREMNITLYLFGDNNHDGVVNYKDFYKWSFWYYPYSYIL